VLRECAMNPDQMKTLLIRDREFLKSLYESSTPKARNLLNFASDAKLNTLIKFLFMVSNGHIKIKREHFDSLSNHHHVKLFKKHLDTKAGLQRLLSAERKAKLQYLYKFSACFNELLFTLFNKILH